MLPSLYIRTYTCNIVIVSEPAERKSQTACPVILKYLSVYLLRIGTFSYIITIFIKIRKLNNTVINHQCSNFYTQYQRISPTDYLIFIKQKMVILKWRKSDIKIITNNGTSGIKCLLRKCMVKDTSFLWDSCQNYNLNLMRDYSRNPS